MPQLAKNAPQTERVYLLLRGENRLNSTYKTKVFAPTTIAMHNELSQQRLYQISFPE